MSTRFHLAFPVHNLEKSRQFYVKILGCEEGRSSDSWIDFNLFGHQIVAHLSPDDCSPVNTNSVDTHNIPCRHFGVILEWGEWEKLIQNLKKPRIAISPIVDGDSIKGPTSKIMQEMGIEVSSSSIAKHYQGLIDGIIIDQSDEAQVNNIEKMGIQVKLANIIIKTKTEKNKLAQESLEFLDEISKS